MYIELGQGVEQQSVHGSPCVEEDGQHLLVVEREALGSVLIKTSEGSEILLGGGRRASLCNQRVGIGWIAHHAHLYAIAPK